MVRAWPTPSQPQAAGSRLGHKQQYRTTFQSRSARTGGSSAGLSYYESVATGPHRECPQQAAPEIA